MRIVAVDIETMGLLHETPLPEITCVCMHDGQRDYAFRLIGRRTPEERAADVSAIVALLDEADVLAGFNAPLFDLEFMRRAFGLDDAHMLRWVLKCVDPFMCARCLVGAPTRLQHMLELNGLGSKTASGCGAIEMAQAERWDELLAYCSMDARLTYELCALEWFRVTPGLECRLDWGRSPPRFRLAGNTTASSAVAPAFASEAAWPMMMTLFEP